MNQEHKESFRELFDYIFKGDQDAIDVCCLLVDIADTWDDIVDKDKPVSAQAVDKAFVGALFELQRRPIWFNAGLSYHVLNAFLKWRDANDIETNPLSTDDDLAKSYMLRAGLYDIFVLVAYHLHGDEWAREIGPGVRKFYAETLKDYIEEMRNA